MVVRKISLAKEALQEQHSTAETNEHGAKQQALASDTEKLLNDYKESHQAISKAQTEQFKAYCQERQVAETNRKVEVLSFKKAILDEVKVREDEVAALINHFNTARTEMSNNLRKELTTYVNTISQDTATLLSSFNVEHREMAIEQQALLATHFENLKSQDLSRCEQTKAETEARREFLFELLDLDFGLEK